VLVTSSGGDWTRVSSANRSAQVDGNVVSLKTMELRGSGMSEQTRGGHLVVWQIYWINGTLTSNDYLAKAYSALYRLTGWGDDSAVIVVYTAKDATGNPEAALESFMTANYAAINDVLKKTRAQK
jgi:EpsI family protein